MDYLPNCLNYVGIIVNTSLIFGKNYLIYYFRDKKKVNTF